MLSQSWPLFFRVLNKAVSSVDHVLDGISVEDCVVVWILEEDLRILRAPVPDSRPIWREAGKVAFAKLLTAEVSLIPGEASLDWGGSAIVLLFDIVLTCLGWTHEACCVPVLMVKRVAQYCQGLEKLGIQGAGEPASESLKKKQVCEMYRS